MGNLNGKSLRFSAEVNVKLEKFARKLGRSKLMVFCQMVDYFYRTGKDPLDISDELLRKTLSKNHDAYTSFIKVQEKDLLIPMREESRRMVASQEKIVKFFNEQLIPSNKKLLDNQNAQMEKFKETDKLIRMVYNRMEEKLQLKKRFMRILENYTQSRDSLGRFDGAEKRELIERSKRQVEEL
ncbi:BfmA/BtgA family mobilization protein [Pedobacter sp. UC225_65]|uniref:BfmA/BtgA family mobilization protein n=1 Tax=Pedobacter sp. UC225_65 TaxID=3350173 RepID=UPI00366B5672